MRQRKRGVGVVFFSISLILLAGCRQRITAGKEADEILPDPEKRIVYVAPEEEAKTEEETDVEEETETEEETEAEEESRAEKGETIPKSEVEMSSEVPKEQSQSSSSQTTDFRRERSIDGIGEGNGENSENGQGSGEEGTGGSGGLNGSGGSGSGENGTEKPPEESTENPTEPERVPITVHLNGNGGRVEGNKRSIEVYNGESYGDLPEVSRGGYTFAGWFTQQEGGERVSAETIVTAEDSYTLYAQWATREKFTVSFVIPDEYKCWLGARVKSIEVYNGQTYGSAFPVPVCRRGYTFLGWFTDPEGGYQVTSEDTVNLSGDQALYPHLLYDAVSYWGGVLDNAPIYSCQIKSIYMEYEADNVTTSYSGLISMTCSVNAARAVSDVNITDEEIRNLNADVIIKCVGDMGAAGAYYDSMAARFPGKHIYVVPNSAEWGSQAEILYYALYMGSILYPEAFAGVDLDAAGADLGVSGFIYG